MTIEDQGQDKSSVSETTPQAQKLHTRRQSSGQLCTACDQCYRCKVKCSGEKPVCERCQTNKSACTYSTGKPLGKPKGSKNKVQKSRFGQDPRRKSVKICEKPVEVWNLNPPAKRKSDGDDVPSAKRSFIVPDTLAQYLPLNKSFPLELSDDPQIRVSPPPIDPQIACSAPQSGLSTETAPFFLGSAGMEACSTPDKPDSFPSLQDEPFPTIDEEVQLDGFDWFTDTSKPPAASTFDRHDEGSIHEPPKTPPVENQDNFLNIISADGSPLDSACGSFPRSSFACLCDPMALSIISDLQTVQTKLSPLDSALLLARKGFSTVSSSLSCPSCLSSSKSIFFACILIIQQVFSCYGTVRAQGTKMLSTPDPQYSPRSVVSIGDFEVEDEESCHGVLDAIVKAEMERSRGVIGGLERWAETGGVSQGSAGLLLQTLKEEIGC